LRPTAAAFRSLAPRAALAVAFAIAVVLRIVHFDPGARSPDEELWTRFGASLAREGPAWQVRLVHDFNRDADVDYPWQQRIGYTGLVALAMRASGDTTVRAVEELSIASGLGAIALTGALAWETLGAWPAVAAVSFLAVSPLDLGLARRAWQDDVVLLIATLMLAAFVRAVTGGRRRWWLAFFALSAYAMTVKESLAIPAVFGTLGLAASEWARTRRPRDAALALAGGAAAALVALGVIVLASGGWSELRTTLELGRVANAPDEYLRQYQTGGVLDYYGRGLLKLQPVPWLLAFAFAAFALARPSALGRDFPGPRSRRALLAIALHLALFCAVAFSYASKNMRFLSPVFPAVALLAAAALRGLHAAAGRRGRVAGAVAAAALAALVVLSAVRDVRCFRHYFVEDEIQDLATPWFTQADAQDRADRAAEGVAK
jgi:4-amino-4-deoxy-L-arabinose transferase-like glycosyltransferase